jgi:hypothetical protein
VIKIIKFIFSKEEAQHYLLWLCCALHGFHHIEEKFLISNIYTPKHQKAIMVKMFWNLNMKTMMVRCFEIQTIVRSYLDK